MKLRWRPWFGVALSSAFGGSAVVAASTLVEPRAAATAGSVFAAIAASAASFAVRRTERDRGGAQVLRNLVVAGNDPLLRVRDLDDPIALGIHPAAGPQSPGKLSQRVPAFVARDVTHELHDALRDDRFVLLVGDSMSGKSRVAYEAMRALLPDHVFVLPGSRSGLSSVEDAIRGARRCVIWLNDLDRFLGPYGLTPTQVAQWRAGSGRSVVLLATMQASRYAEYRAPSHGESDAAHELVRAGQAVLNMAHVIRLERQWSDVELARASQFTDDPRIAEALKHANRFGLAEYMTAAPQLYHRWIAAWTAGGHARGAAIVAAAIDAKRCGWLRPIPRELLVQLHHSYLTQRGGSGGRPESIDAAFKWATAPLRSTSSLLIRVANGRSTDHDYLVFDYLPEMVDAADEPARIPDQTWRELIAAATPADAYDIGQAAFERQAFDWSEAAFAKAAQAGEHAALLAQARAVGKSGRMDEAVELIQASIERTTLRLGENFPDAPRSRQELQLWRTRRNASVLGPDHPDTLASRHQLAYWAGQAGHAREAVSELRSLAEDRARVLGADHPDTLASRHELADWTGEAGDWRAAVLLFDEVIADRRRVMGSFAADTLRSRTRRAEWIGRGGEPVRAVEVLTDVCDALITHFGPDNVDTLAALHDLAYWTGHAGDPHGAVRRFEDVIAARNRILGRDHPDTLTSRSNHARWVGESGRPAEAVRLFDAVIADRERVLGPDHPDTLWSRHRRVYWTASVGDPAEAVRVLSVVVADRERVLGAEHPQTLDSRHHLARWVARAGDPAEAVRILEEVLSDRQRVMGPEHPDTLATWHRLALCLGLAGDRRRAVGMLGELIDRRTIALGADHLDTLSTRHEFAYWTAMAGDRRSAIELFLAVAKDREAKLGPKHPYTLDTQHEIAYWTGVAGDQKTAIALFGSVIADRRHVLGADHPRTLESRHELALSIAESGDAERATELLSRVVADRRRTLGPDHEDTLDSLHEQAYWTNKAGDPAAALKLFEAVVAGRERVLGADHPLTLDSRYNVVRISKPIDYMELTHLLELTLKQQTRTLSSDHPDVLQVRRRLALIARDHEQGRLLLASIDRDCTKVLGENHPFSLLVRYDLACYTWEEDAVEAVDMLRAVLDAHVRVLGPQHPMTLTSKARLNEYLATAPMPNDPDADRDTCRVELELLEDAPLIVRGNAHIALRLVPCPDHPWARPDSEHVALDVVATPLSDADIEPAVSVFQNSDAVRFEFVPFSAGEHIVRFTLYTHSTGTALQQVETTLTVAAAAGDRESSAMRDQGE